MLNGEHGAVSGRHHSASQFDKGGQVMTSLLPMPNANPFQTGGYNYALQVAFPRMDGSL